MTKQLLYINGLAIVFAVIHHTVDWLLTAMFWWTDRYRDGSIPNFDLMNGPAYYAIRLIDQIAVVGVCVFLVVSGYFIIFASGRSQAHINATDYQSYPETGSSLSNLVTDRLSYELHVWRPADLARIPVETD